MFNNSRFIENNRRVIGYVLEHNAVCSDPDVITNANSSENLGAGTDEDIITNNGSFPSAASYSYLVKDGHISPYGCPPAMTIPLMPCAVILGGAKKFSHTHEASSLHPGMISAQLLRISW